MKKRVVKYNVTLVKESSRNYEVDTTISNPAIYANLFKKVYNINELCEEVFLIACVDTKNKIIGTFEVSKGSVNASIVHPREVFKRALLLNSSAIILAHNHPSGDPTPSPEDFKVTNRLKEGGDLLGVRVLDHVIIGDGKFYSFKEHGGL